MLCTCRCSRYATVGGGKKNILRGPGASPYTFWWLALDQPATFKSVITRSRGQHCKPTDPSCCNSLRESGTDFRHTAALCPLASPNRLRAPWPPRKLLSFHPLRCKTSLQAGLAMNLLGPSTRFSLIGRPSGARVGSGGSRGGPGVSLHCSSAGSHSLVKVG